MIKAILLNLVQGPEGIRYSRDGSTDVTLTKIVDALVSLGYLESLSGWKPLGLKSVFKASEKLQNQLESFKECQVESKGPVVELPPEKPLELRNQKRESIAFEDTPETLAMKEFLLKVNNLYATTTFELDEKPLAKPYLTRIFNEDWQTGGRFYGSHQSLRKVARAKIKIDGEETVELDVPCLHPRLVAHLAGVKLSGGDLYYLPGVERKLVKLAMNICWASKSRKGGNLDRFTAF